MSLYDEVRIIILVSIILAQVLLTAYYLKSEKRKRAKKRMIGGGCHRWSGWPGAFCLYCGMEDRIEIAVGEGYFDPYTLKWDSEQHRKEYTNGPCPFVPPGVDPYSLPYPLPNNWEYMV